MEEDKDGNEEGSNAEAKAESNAANEAKEGNHDAKKTMTPMSKGTSEAF